MHSVLASLITPEEVRRIASIRNVDISWVHRCCPTEYLEVAFKFLTAKLREKHVKGNGSYVFYKRRVGAVLKAMHLEVVRSLAADNIVLTKTDVTHRVTYVVERYQLVIDCLTEVLRPKPTGRGWDFQAAIDKLPSLTRHRLDGSPWDEFESGRPGRLYDPHIHQDNSFRV